MSSFRRVLICQSQACRKGGSVKVFSRFQAHPVADVAIEPVGCLGQCGNGPMVLILPEQAWYGAVQPDEVPALVERHLQRGTPIRSMLYRKFHAK